MSGHLMLLTIIVLVLDVPRTSRLGLYLSIGDIAAREAENQAHWKQTVSKILLSCSLFWSPLALIPHPRSS